MCIGDAIFTFLSLSPCHAQKVLLFYYHVKSSKVVVIGFLRDNNIIFHPHLPRHCHHNLNFTCNILKDPAIHSSTSALFVQP